MRHGLTLLGTLTLLGIVLATNALPAAKVHASERVPAPVTTTPHFAFYSDFSTNLNDALIVAGAARNDGVPELFDSGPAASCFAELPPSARLGWDLAVDWHARIVSETAWHERPQYVIRLHLAGLDEDLDARAGRFTAVAEGFRMAAAPAYRECRWVRQDEENRRWLAELLPRLRPREAALAERLEDLYRTPWYGLPMPVDIVAHVPPHGASCILAPHVLVSSSVARRDALEIVFHEASHALMGRRHPVRTALATAAEELGVKLPRELWHVVLFYMTGEVVRWLLEETGEPGYEPYMYVHDLWAGSWGSSREAIETAWPAYMSGERTLTEAATDLLRALGDSD